MVKKHTNFVFIDKDYSISVDKDYSVYYNIYRVDWFHNTNQDLIK